MYTKRTDDTVRIHVIKDPGEAEVYSDILTRKHYLRSSAYSRRTIVHVARRGREDVAILTWESETRHRFGTRDRLIGWTDGQKAQRHRYCIENRRFLMLEEGSANLASHILAQSVARLSEDARRQYGHDVLLAETFVDPSRGYEGTCYKAAGWTEAGLTKGGHGRESWSKKLYYVKELKQDALVKLRAPELSAADTINPRQSVLFLEQLDIKGLKERLEKIPDYRKNLSCYPLVTLLALIVAAVLSGATNAKEVSRWVSSLSTEFLKTLGCRRAPSHTTLWRVITNIGHAALCKELCGWLAEQSKGLHLASGFRHLSLDGKTLRAGSKAHGSQLHVVTMIEAVSKTVMDQRLTDDKSNEIPKVAEMLRETPIDAQTVVTADALHTQRETAETIVKKTVGTFLRPRTTSGTCARRSLKGRPRKPGLSRALQRIMTMDA
jgi:hypothetical protein